MTAMNSLFIFSIIGCKANEERIRMNHPGTSFLTKTTLTTCASVPVLVQSKPKHLPHVSEEHPFCPC